MFVVWTTLGIELKLDVFERKKKYGALVSLEGWGLGVSREVRNMFMREIPAIICVFLDGRRCRHVATLPMRVTGESPGVGRASIDYA